MLKLTTTVKRIVTLTLRVGHASGKANQNNAKK